MAAKGKDLFKLREAAIPEDIPLKDIPVVGADDARSVKHKKSPPSGARGSAVSTTESAGKRFSQAIKTGNINDVQRLLATANVEVAHTDALGAAATGNWEVLRWFISDKNVSPTIKDKEGRPLLMLAAKAGNMEMVQWLAGRDGVDPDDGDHFGQTAVSVAASDGHWEIVKYLIGNAKADPDSEVIMGDSQTPVIIVAAKAWQWELVQWMTTEMKADVEVEDENNIRLLVLAAQAGQWDVVKAIASVEHLKRPVDLNAKTSDGANVAYLAAEQEQFELVRWLVLKGSRVELRRKTGPPLVCLLAKAQEWALVDWMVREKNAHIHYTEEELTPIFLASEAGQWDLVKFLVTKTNLRNLQLSGLNAALRLAARQGNLEQVKVLVNTVYQRNKKKVLDINSFLKESRLPRKKEGAGGHVSLGGALGQEHEDDDDREGGEDIEVTERPFGMTCLLDAAEAGAWGVVQWLLESCPGWDPTDKSDEDREDLNELLAIAGCSGTKEKAQWLTRKGAEYSYRKFADEKGPTVIARIAYANQWDVVKWMLTEGNADPLKSLGSMDEPLVHIAASQGQWDIVKFLLFFISVDVETKEMAMGRSLLAVAVSQGELATVKWLVKSMGASVTALDKQRETPLLIAANEGFWDIVRWLICESGVQLDRDARDHQRRTVMAIAVAAGQEEIVEFLFDHECDCDDIDMNHNSAVEIAATNDPPRTDVLKWLIDEGECMFPLDMAPTVAYAAAEVTSARGIEAAKEHWVLLHWVMERTSDAPAVDIISKKHESTALHMAAKCRAWAEVEYLIIRCGAHAELNKALNLLFEHGPGEVVMRIFVHMLMVSNNPKADDAVIRRFKRVLPRFVPEYVADLCRVEVNQSQSPITVCLSMARMFSKLAVANLVSYGLYMRLADEFSKTATRILDKLPTDRLASWVLEEPQVLGEAATAISGASNTAVGQALDFDDLTFVGSARLNRIMQGWWGTDKTLKAHFLNKPMALLRTPSFKLLLDNISLIAFLTLFSVVIFQQTPVEAPIAPLEYSLLAYGIAYFWRECLNMRTQGLKLYFDEKANWLDFSMCVFLFISFVCRFAPGSKPDGGSYSVVYTIAMVVADLLFWTRSLQIWASFAALGPLLISLYKMVPDILAFSFLWIILQISFFFAFLFGMESTWNGYTGITYLMLSTYAGQYDNEILAYDPEQQWRFVLVQLIAVIFMLISAVVFVNLFIAMMAYTFDAVKEKAEAEFVFLRVSVQWKFDQSENLLPPPFNVVVSILYLVEMIAEKLIMPCRSRPQGVYCSHCHHFMRGSEVKSKNLSDIAKQAQAEWPTWDRIEFDKHPGKFCQKCFRVRRPLSYAQFVHERLSGVVLVIVLWWWVRLLYSVVIELPNSIARLYRSCKQYRRRARPFPLQLTSRDKMKKQRAKRTATMRRLPNENEEEDLDDEGEDNRAMPALHHRVRSVSNIQLNLTQAGGYEWRDYQDRKTRSFFKSVITTIPTLSSKVEDQNQEELRKVTELHNSLARAKKTLATVERVAKYVLNNKNAIAPGAFSNPVIITSNNLPIPSPQRSPNSGPIPEPPPLPKAASREGGGVGVGVGGGAGVGVGAGVVREEDRPDDEDFLDDLSGDEPNDLLQAPVHPRLLKSYSATINPSPRGLSPQPLPSPGGSANLSSAGLPILPPPLLSPQMVSTHIKDKRPSVSAALRPGPRLSLLNTHSLGEVIGAPSPRSPARNLLNVGSSLPSMLGERNASTSSRSSGKLQSGEFPPRMPHPSGDPGNNPLRGSGEHHLRGSAEYLPPPVRNTSSFLTDPRGEHVGGDRSRSSTRKSDE